MITTKLTKIAKNSKTTGLSAEDYSSPEENESSEADDDDDNDLNYSYQSDYDNYSLASRKINHPILIEFRADHPSPM